MAITDGKEFGEALRAADEATRSLMLYADALDDPICRTYAEILDLLTPLSNDFHSQRREERGASENSDSSTRAPHMAAVLYRRLFALLAQEAEFSPTPLTGDAWQNHLLNRILRDENPFSLKAERASLDETGPVVRQAVERDLSALQTLYHFDGRHLRDAVLRRNPDLESLPPLEGFRTLRSAPVTTPDRRDAEIKASFAAEQRWPALLPALAGYIRQRGLGIFQDFRAFRWENRSGEGKLAGIAEPDPIRLDELIGDGGERRLLIQNTEHFVAGFPANNVLLYGDRGTGKSSSVKALLHDYADRGLRMIEVQKEHLGDFPRIIRQLRDRPERFILFIDDLSFEEHETHYKDLKALLEGSLEARPENILLYATSNRRHLVKERFSDRIHKMEDDEIHLNDTTEEKLSLSDRFGLTLTFIAPTQERYLGIVRGMAERRGLRLAEEELSARALAWAAQRGGRSGRVARQFMDHLTAELRMEEQNAAKA
jgi:predicted AAA+ superfamily ATPase